MKNTKKMISTQFCINGKAINCGKINKIEAIKLTGAKVLKTIAPKTYIMINGVPCNVKTGKPFVKLEN